MVSELPAGWASCQLGDLLDHIQAGKNVKCDERPPEGEEPGLVKISAVTWGKFDELESKTLLSDDGLEARNKIQPGDLLISRANTLELVGAPVIVHAITKNLYLSDKVLRLDIAEPLRAWALTCLKSKSGRSQIEALATGNQLSMRNISQDALRSIELPLPPLAEQKRIAQKLDALLAQVDTLKARIDAIPALLKRFRMSILTAATSGTTFDGSSVITNQSEAKGSSFMLNDETFDLPKGWSHAPVDSVLHSARRLCYGVVQPGSEVESGVDMIRVCDIEDGTIAWNDLRKIASEVDDEYRRSRVQRGDILMSIVGSIGRAAIVREDRPVNIARAVARLSVDQSQLTPEWLFLWITSPKVQWWLASSSREVARKTLNLKELSELPVPLPPREVQAEIVLRVEQLFAYADQLETKVAAAQQRIDALTQSLLAKAFRGELVPQDPTDEPARALLERIRAQRAATPKPKRGRKAATS